MHITSCLLAADAPCTPADRYNVLGHFKLCTVIVGGFLVFQDPLNFNQGVGIAVALVGIFVYTYFKFKLQLQRI